MASTVLVIRLLLRYAKKICKVLQMLSDSTDSEVHMSFQWVELHFETVPIILGPVVKSVNLSHVTTDLSDIQFMYLKQVLHLRTELVNI